MRKIRLLWLGVFSMSASVASFAACGGDTNNVPSPEADAAAEGAVPVPTPTPTPDANTTTDAGAGDAASDADLDGDIIDDGGSNINDDGGDGGDASDDGGIVLDGGSDAGACNALTNDAPAIMSNCISLGPRLNGGAYVAGKYYLTGVAALGSPAFCQNTFNPVKFQQTVDLGLGVAVGTATFQSVSVVGNRAPRRATSKFESAPNNGSPMSSTPTCPTVGAAVKVPYGSFMAQGKQRLWLRLPYGGGEAIYQYTKQ